jgi:hypothetical protein
MSCQTNGLPDRIVDVLCVLGPGVPAKPGLRDDADFVDHGMAHGLL